MERKRPQTQKDRNETCRAGEAGGGNKHGENDETNEVGRSVEETDFVCQDRTDTLGSMERKRPQTQKDCSESSEAGEEGGGNEHGENDDTNEVGGRNGSVEETDFVRQNRTETSISSIKKNQKTLPNQRYTPMMAGKQDYVQTPIKRPSLCCVLIGRHWSMAVSKGML